MLPTMLMLEMQSAAAGKEVRMQVSRFRAAIQSGEVSSRGCECLCLDGKQVVGM